MSSNLEHFRVDLRFLQEMGERLISKDEIAILELVKNSYDADADFVKVTLDDNKIIVLDDGDGMDQSEIIAGWLTIGTHIKSLKKYSESGRRLLGKKGVGRLAILRLGKLITIYTKKENGQLYKCVFDWRFFHQNAISDESYTPLESYKIIFDKCDEKKFLDRSKGTEIIIEELNSEWPATKKEEIYKSLSKLIEPRSYVISQQGQKKNRLEKSGKEFDISVIIDGAERKVQPSEEFLNPHYLIDIDIDETGKYSGILSWNLDQDSNDEPQNGSIDDINFIKKRIKYSEESGDSYSLFRRDIHSNKRLLSCGPFSLKVGIWDLDSKNLRNKKTEFKKWSGISLVKDNFRIVQPNIDWLNLDLRRVQYPTKRVSSNQIIGSIYISDTGNPNLIDLTNREGLLENNEVDVLKSIIFSFLDKIEDKRYKLRRRKTISAGSFLSHLDTGFLKETKKLLPQKEEDEMDVYISNLSEFRKTLEDWMLGRDRMATLGKLSSDLIHESRNALALIIDNYPYIEEDLDKIQDNKIKENLFEVVKGGKDLNDIFKHLDPFMIFKPARKDLINLHNSIEFIRELYQKRLKDNKISLINEIPESLNIRGYSTDFSIIVANLVDNAIYWISDANSEKRIILCKAVDDNSKICLIISDSGPGIDPDIQDTLFDQGESQKPNGTGLGLAILKDIVESYGGSVLSGTDPDLKGAKFEIFIPYKW